MELTKETNFRVLQQDNIAVPCYFYGLFKSPGLESYPNREWVNSDYELIKSKNLDAENCARIANNLWKVGEKFNLFANLDYFVMMPLKSTSVSSLASVIAQLIKLINEKSDKEVKLINDLFQVTDYRKFWENRLKLAERKQEIANKITLQTKYQHFFDGKNVVIVDDVVSTGTSIVQVTEVIKEFNDDLDVTALTYGSVYEWEKIYT